MGLLDLVGRDVLLAHGRLTRVLEAVAVEMRFPLVIMVEYGLISSKSRPQAKEIE